jgi:hypothetical protein
MPNVLFVDFKELVYDSIRLFETELSGYKLNDILNYFKINNKIEQDYTEMNT